MRPAPSLVALGLFVSFLSPARALAEELPGLPPLPPSLTEEEHDHEHPLDDAGLGGKGGEEDEEDEPERCVKATAAQLKVVNDGNAKLEKFLEQCRRATDNSPWCDQLTRPNPGSRATFACTYGANQPHTLIHPTESTWTNAIKAAQLIRDLEGLGVKVAEVYNWWRPEPYNKNVGGAASRHPFGTSVDVRFATLADMEKGHKLLCQFRKKGRLRALGYYGSTGLHFGVGDANGNTWGKDCPARRRGKR